ncbi:hypothetical protein B5S31_g4459 [[Candida] boidinii]|nr:hypothetical protein B5S31_g4459 [[Candida] boidinii]
MPPKENSSFPNFPIFGKPNKQQQQLRQQQHNNKHTKELDQNQIDSDESTSDDDNNYSNYNNTSNTKLTSIPLTSLSPSQSTSSSNNLQMNTDNNINNTNNNRLNPLRPTMSPLESIPILEDDETEYQSPKLPVFGTPRQKPSSNQKSKNLNTNTNKNTNKNTNTKSQNIKPQLTKKNNRLDNYFSRNKKNEIPLKSNSKINKSTRFSMDLDSDSDSDSEDDNDSESQYYNNSNNNDKSSKNNQLSSDSFLSNNNFLKDNKRKMIEKELDDDFDQDFIQDATANEFKIPQYPNKTSSTRETTVNHHHNHNNNNTGNTNTELYSDSDLSSDADDSDNSSIATKPYIPQQQQQQQKQNSNNSSKFTNQEEAGNLISKILSHISVKSHKSEMSNNDTATTTKENSNSIISSTSSSADKTSKDTEKEKDKEKEKEKEDEDNDEDNDDDDEIKRGRTQSFGERIRRKFSLSSGHGNGTMSNQNNHEYTRHRNLSKINEVESLQNTDFIGGSEHLFSKFLNLGNTGNGLTPGSTVIAHEDAKNDGRDNNNNNKNDEESNIENDIPMQYINPQQLHEEAKEIVAQHVPFYMNQMNAPTDSVLDLNHPNDRNVHEGNSNDTNNQENHHDNNNNNNDSTNANANTHNNHNTNDAGLFVPYNPAFMLDSYDDNYKDSLDYLQTDGGQEGFDIPQPKKVRQGVASSLLALYQQPFIPMSSEYTTTTNSSNNFNNSGVNTSGYNTPSTLNSDIDKYLDPDLLDYKLRNDDFKNRLNKSQFFNNQNNNSNNMGHKKTHSFTNLIDLKKNKLIHNKSSASSIFNSSKKMFFSNSSKDELNYHSDNDLGISNSNINSNSNSRYNLPHFGKDKSKKHKKTRDARLKIKEKMFKDKKNTTARITVHIADVLQRQVFILTLCKAFMLYGAPTHRLEEYMTVTARVLEIDGSFIYFPGCMIVSFGDSTTRTSDMKLVRCAQGLDLGKLDEAHEIYKSVVHDRVGVEEASNRINELLSRKPRYNIWCCILIYGFASAMVTPWGFGGSWIDMPISFGIGLVVGFLQFVISPKSTLYSSVFEVTASIVVSFIGRAIGSINGGSTFCFSGIVQGSLALILPGYIILCGSLELQSRNIVAGSVRMFYAIIYSLFLGFGITLGAALYGWIDSNATSATTCQSNVSPWFRFLLVPMFTIGLALINQAKISQLPAMIVISGGGYVVNYFSGKHFINAAEFTSTIGCFIIGFLSNLYSRIGKTFLGKRMNPGMAVVNMLPGIFVQVPSGIASQGSLLAGINTADAIVNKNGTSTSTNSNAFSSTSLSFGIVMVEVAIGISVGLFAATIAVYPFGKKRTGLFTL